MRQQRSHTKVIATIGPKTRNKEILEKLVHEGVDVLRINLSHDTHEEHLKTIRYIKELNEELGSNVAILGDLQGPKLRVGDMENDEVLLKDGQEFSFVTTPCIGNSEKAYLSYERLPADVTKGEKILVDDVLFTGRTVRAAMDALIDFGRPKKIELAILIDRGDGDRELPIMANYVGSVKPIGPNETINVYLKEAGFEDHVTIEAMGSA